MSLPPMTTNPYRDLSTTELEAVLIKLHDESDAHIARWEKKVAEARARAEEKKRLSAMDKPSIQQRVAPTATEIMATTQKLSQTELELKVAKHNATKMAEGYKRLEAKHLHAEKIQIRLKNENRILYKTIASLTTDLEATAARVESDLQIENDDLRKEIAQLRSELKHQTEKCQAKDTTIAEMKRDIVAFQEFMAVEQESDSQNFLHRHDACNEMEALLREQAHMDSLRFADLEEKMEVVKAERDDLHNKLKAVHESFSIQCSGTWDCTSCVPHLEHAVRSSRAAEACALQSADQAIRDRMHAYEQLHRLHKQASQYGLARDESWVGSPYTPDMSSATASPTHAPDLYYAGVDRNSNSSVFSDFIPSSFSQTVTPICMVH
ncbi:hypothetical protein E8E13_003429 [Curvularia kusanoi]|uniref:Uncharacterized protein n=1 Tax=Curvularia kusanoi TaxID=90978 RepID=A0A9P4WBH9_CURKU|nr:hypothetical protein E8E13_003429 [Curvularia kusanoi]